jgi:hypothetical protein
VSENFLDGVVRGLSRNVAFTSPGAEDPRLRGRTYAIPFEDVWQSTRLLVSGKLKRWELVEADDQEGLIRGVAHGRLDRFTSAITIRITLDPDAQTRVDAMSASQVGRADLGVNARRLRRYFAALDAMLAERRGTTIESLTIDPSGASSATP